MARLALRSMIEELNIPRCSIHECKNGKELAHAIDDLKPDLAIVDIKMPLLNGLEAIAESKKVSPNTEVIITTGFSEFGYAKKAIELGVYDYLLKPVDPEKLNEIVHNILKSKHNALIEANNKFQSRMIGLYYDQNPIGEELLNETNKNIHYAVCMFYIDSIQPVNELYLLKKRVMNNLKALVDDILEEKMQIANLNIGYNSLTVVFSYNIENYNKINKYIKGVKDLLINEGNNDSRITALISENVNSYKYIKTEIDEIEKYAALRIILGTGKNYCTNELCANGNYKKYLSMAKLIDELSEYFKNNVYVKLCDLLDKIERIMANEKDVLSETMIDDNINTFLRNTIGFKYNGGCSKAWLKALNDYKDSFLRKSGRSKDVTEQIMEFINENFMYEISISTLSEIFNLTPNYISSLFHKKTNMKLVDYLSKVRIIKAQNLLSETDMNVEEICESIGYHSTRHFSKLFKNYTGYSPVEYRKMEVR